MGCGSTYNGSARYRLGPTYVPQNERSRVQLPEPPPPGPQIDLSNLKKNSLPSQVIDMRTDGVGNLHQSNAPSRIPEQDEIYRTNQMDRQSNIAAVPPNQSRLFPLPGIPELSEIRHVESQDMAALGASASVYIPPYPQGPQGLQYSQNMPQIPHPSTLPYPPPQVQMVSRLAGTPPQVMTLPPQSVLQRSEKDTVVRRADGSTVNIHETSVRAPPALPPLHLPPMKLEPMGD